MILDEVPLTAQVIAVKGFSTSYINHSEFFTQYNTILHGSSKLLSWFCGFIHFNIVSLWPLISLSLKPNRAMLTSILSLSLCHSLSFSPSLSFCHYVTLSLPPSLCHSVSFSHTHTLSPSLSISLSLCLIYSRLK